MHCPFCAEADTKVIDSRLAAESNSVRRRRECQNPECGERFTTFETAELLIPQMIKSDASREPFNEEKLRGGLLRALEKRPVAVETIDATVNRIKLDLQRLGEREVPTRIVGELVMNELRRLDDVAYVRFASVYRRFEDARAFREELDRLGEESVPAASAETVVPVEPVEPAAASTEPAPRAAGRGRPRPDSRPKPGKDTQRRLL